MSKCLEDIIPGEKQKARATLRAIPTKVRRFYVPRYGVGIGNEAGEFLGLVCKCCKQWQEFGHNADCLVKSL